ncbi:MAG: thioredoxin family protein, partial [Caldilinea sp.]
LAFFHSNTCDSCKEMMAVVEEVYPEFAGSVGLVDVDAYDARNAGLLRSIGIRAIPTVVFFDRTGAGKMQIGGMPAADLRQVLSELQQGG